MAEIQDTQGALWEVFIQSKKGLPFKHVGSVHAFDKEMAVQNARDLYTRRGEGKGMWVVPASSIVAVDPLVWAIQFGNAHWTRGSGDGSGIRMVD